MASDESFDPEPKNEPNKLFDGEGALLAAEQEGYAKTLKNRHVQMIALGGAIGTGLFLGAGGRLNSTGPSLVFCYAICGLAVFMVLRALAEMVIRRPSSGSFVSYTREYMGEKGAFVAGWMYFVLWAGAGIADITAVALYAKYWGVFGSIPQWLIALLALLCVLAVNLISARMFGEIEFWAAIIKVLALSLFIAVGIYFIISRTPVDGVDPGPALISDNGGFFPHGYLAAVIVIPGVVFAYSALELVSIAAGETPNPAAIVPRATNSVIYRILIFYCGSVLLLAMLMPWSAYSADESPFVTFFSAIGVPAAGSIMNFVVLTAALSSVNSGLYATGRILKSMSVAGSAPEFVGKMSKRHVPAGGILFVCAAYGIGIFLNYLVPASAFEIVLNFAALGILSTWSFILVCHLIYLRQAKKNGEPRPKFKMPFAPYTNYITLGFLVFIVVMMWFDVPVGRITLICIIPIAGALVIGWFVVRNKVAAIAAEYAAEDLAHSEADPAPS